VIAKRINAIAVNKHVSVKSKKLSAVMPPGKKPKGYPAALEATANIKLMPPTIKETHPRAFILHPLFYYYNAWRFIMSRYSLSLEQITIYSQNLRE